MSIKIILLFIILLFFSLGNVSAQTDRLVFRNITFEDGLPFIRTCNSILQAHNGFIWIGSDVGLHRFDGNDFRNFTHIKEDNKSIRKGKVNTLFQDKSNNLWIGASTGADLYDPNQLNFVHISLFADNSFTSINESVRGFMENYKGELFCYTHFFIYKYNPDKKSFVRISTGFEVIDKGEFIHESVIMVDDYFLSGANTGGVFVFSLERKKFWNIDITLLGANKVFDVFKSSNGQVWIGTDKGVSVANSIDELINNPKKNLVNIAEARGKLVNKIVEDKNAQIWASTDGDGIYNINPKTLTVSKIRQNDVYKRSILNNKVALVYVDNQNNLWSFFNSYGFSIANLNQNGTFQTYSSRNRMANTLSGNIVTALAQDKTGKIWIGTDGDGLNCFDQSKGTFTHYYSDPSNKNSLSSDVILCLFVDSNNQLWIGTYQGGLCKYEQSANRFTIYNSLIGNQNNKGDIDVSGITEDKNGNLIIATITDGLKILNKASGAFQKYDDNVDYNYKLSHSGITTLLTDSKGDIWVGTYYGLNRINASTRIITKFFSNEKDTLTINENEIDCIFEDSKNNIWIGTSNGLNLFNESNQTFKHTTIKDGLFDNQINSIIEDNEGNIWLGTNKGLSRINPITFQIRNFGEKYDLPGRLIFHQAVLKAKNGDLFFGGNRGFTILKPQLLSTPKTFPKLYITDLKIFDNSVKVGEKVNGHIVLKHDITISNRINLRHTDNSFSFTFSTLDFASISKVDYYYKMEGFDKDWRKADYRNRSASYTNLNTGNYTFKVKLVSEIDDKDGIPVEVNVSILPPWWRTWWAFLLYFSIIGGLVTFYLNITLSRIKLRRKLFMEHNEHEKEVEISRIKENFYTNITHEFRTPLTLILGPLEQLAEKYKTDKYIYTQAQVIKRNANRLLILVNELLDFRKIESCCMQIAVCEQNIVDFFTQVAKSFEAHAEIHSIDLKIEPEQNEIKVWFDKNKLEKVFYNILSNAFKYTPDGGNIHCRISITDDQSVSIEIEDNGIGIPEDELNSVFRKYFSARNATEQYSTGIGLYLTKEIVELHKGTISARNNKGKGSCFEVRLKLGNSHLFPHERGENTQNYLTLPQGAIQTKEDFEDSQNDYKVQDNAQENDKQIILLIEDNADVRTFIKNELIQNYDIIEAVDGKQGLEMAYEKIPDLIISDVMMPELDGRSLCLQLKNDQRTNHIPIILLTALADIENKIEGLDVGADSYITKPFHPKHLTVRVTKLLQLRKVLQEKYNHEIKQVSKAFIYEPQDIEKPSVNELFLQRIINIVEKHLSDSNFELDDLCNEMGMNYLQLYRKVKAITNLSLKQFILTLRMKTASKLIESGKFTISEIAYDVGFTSPAYFSEMFRKNFGISPTEYAKKMK